MRQEDPCGYGASLGISVKTGPLYLIPEATDREPIKLIAVVPVYTAIEVGQVAVPGI